MICFGETAKFIIVKISSNIDGIIEFAWAESDCTTFHLAHGIESFTLTDMY